MKKNLFLLLLVCGFAQKIISAEPTTNTVNSGNRFLFVVENSAAMKRSAKAAQQTIRDLIESGVQGEMRAGDTYGIWTFDYQLNTTFPLQRWSPPLGKSLSLSAEDFLKKHRYENKSEFKVVLPKVYSLMKASESITVILISTGNEPIRGTPFDKEMNVIYPQYAKELRDAKLPFVTVLIGYRGRPVAYSVNSSLGPIHIPQPPLKREKIAATETNEVVAATNATPIQETNAVSIPEAAPPQIEPKPDSVVPEIAKVEPETKTASAIPVEPRKIEEKISTETTVAETSPAIPEPKPPKQTDQKSAPEPVVPDASPSVATEPVADEPAAPSIIKKPAEQPSPSIVQEREPKPVASAQQKTNLPIASPAPVTASQSIFTPGKLMLAGVVLLLAAVLLVFLLIRNSRKSQPSIISRSIERKK